MCALNGLAARIFLTYGARACVHKAVKCRMLSVFCGENISDSLVQFNLHNAKKITGMYYNQENKIFIFCANTRVVHFSCNAN